MAASILEPVLVGLALWLGCTMLAFVAGGLLVWRYARRRWRAFRSHGVVVGAGALWEATAPVRWRRADPMAASDVQQWPARRVRKELWRSVDRAGAAVRAADGVGGPTAELPALSRRIRAAAVDLDKVLRVDVAAPVPARLGEQVLEVMRAAEDVRKAALASASDASAQRVHDLTRDAGHELQILDAGLASVQAAFPPQVSR